MKKIISFAIILTAGWSAASQTQPRPTASPQQSQSNKVPQRETAAFDLAEYGVAFQVEPRLLIMMAALEAAGFDPTPVGAQPSVFRALVRRDLARLDPDLRNRLRTFFERNKLPPPATPADQAARYISLAFALGPPPALEAPARSEDLPSSLLEVLDFAPLVQEFYRRSNIDEQMPSYVRAHQAEGDRLRKPTGEMVRSILSYLHTQPITVSLDRVPVKTPTTGKKKSSTTYTTREQQRHFFVVPDLLGAPGAINFRVIGDEYYAVVPEGIDPASSEIRRAYLQYVIDPLLIRYNRDVAARREQIKLLLTEREKAGASVSPDVFLAVSRSLVAAADTRFEEQRRVENLSRAARVNIAAAKDDASRRAISKQLQTDTAAVQDEALARLAEQYERGAVLAFFFADQLKGIESSGFDVANFFVDMISSFDPARESRRLAENSEARQRAIAARAARLASRQIEPENPGHLEAERTRNAALAKRLADIEQVLRLKDYNEAETRLKDLVKDYSREPRIFFALAQTASLAAADATDEDVQAERLNRALGNYRLALEASTPETDRGLVSRAHEAMGRIYAFLENGPEAAREFDEAIKVGDVPGGAFREALAGKKKLASP